MALAEAAKGRGLVEPNPQVGAVIVKDEKVIAKGHHGKFGGPHAEVEAIRAAGADAAGATLYVNLEPCAHQGKTPPCAHAVIEAGIAAGLVPSGIPLAEALPAAVNAHLLVLGVSLLGGLFAILIPLGGEKTL